MLIDVWVYGTFSVARKTLPAYTCAPLYVYMSLTFILMTTVLVYRLLQLSHGPSQGRVLAERCTDDGGSDCAVGKMVRQSVILNCRARVHGMRGRAGAISRSKRPMRSEA